MTLKIQRANALLNLSGKTVVIVGGTKGIGAAAAVQYASLGASVIIAGRTAAAGESVVSRMKSVFGASDFASRKSPVPHFEFKKLDVLSMDACKAFARDVSSSEPVSSSGLNILIMSAGNLNLRRRADTDEGIETTFAMNYLSKFALVNSFLPALQRANDSRVLSILAGGNGGTVNVNDLQNKNSKSILPTFVSANVTAGVLTDMMTMVCYVCQILLLYC
jgi:NAD(P)-dependent dehydrogenase (short-subunit alcohol dehydrogenase family)